MFRDHPAIRLSGFHRSFAGAYCLAGLLGELRRLPILCALVVTFYVACTNTALVGEDDTSSEAYVAQLMAKGAFVRKNKNGDVITIATSGVKNITDRDLEKFSAIRTLKTLQLDGGTISGVGITHLSALPELGALGLENTNLDAAGVAMIAALPKLQTLDLPVTATNQSVAALGNLTELESLSIRGPNFTDAGIRTLNKFKKLRSIRLGAGVTPAGLEMLAELPDLEEIHIGLQLDDSFMAVYAKFPKLRQLSLHYTKVTALGLPHLAKMKNLDTLSLPQVATDAEMDFIADLPKLRNLNLSYAQVTDAGIQKLAKLKALAGIFLPPTCTDASLDVFRGREMASLMIQGEGFTDAAIPKILAMKTLYALDVKDTKITPAALDQLRTRRPALVIHLPPDLGDQQGNKKKK